MENSVLYEVRKGQFLFIQDCDTGYDYTLYNEDGKLIDGGQLNAPDLGIEAVRDEILSLFDLPSCSHNLLKDRAFQLF